MEYIGNIIRPPSEADSMIVQVTVGCSHNMCSFCGTYKGVSFRIKDLETIKRDIEEASSRGIPFDKAFLTDGDVLSMPTDALIKIISLIMGKNRSMKRVGLYGNTKALLKKNPSELRELKDAGLGIVYHGVESGNREVLRRIRKGAFPAHIIKAAAKAIDAGMLLSQTVLLGIGGTELSREHAADTGRLLGEVSPHYASALTVMVLPGTGLHRDSLEGRFILPGKFQLLQELKIMMENLNPRRRCHFASNHASNYLPIRATLPDDRERVIRLIEHVLHSKDESMLKPEHTRAL